MSTRFKLAKITEDATLNISAGKTLDVSGADVSIVGSGTAEITFPSTDGTLAKTTDIPVKATGSEIDTATNDVKFATALALANSKYFKSDETSTLTNKRITKRVKTFTSDATPDIDSDDYDAVTITGVSTLTGVQSITF